MQIGDLIECHGGERGVILDRKDLYPGNPHSPPYSLLIHWMGESPRFAVAGRYTHAGAILKVISRASR